MKRYIIIILVAALSGCATPVKYSVKKTEEGIEFTGKRKVGFFGLWEKEQDYLGPGEYSGKVGDREIKVNTKTEPFKLFGDVNVNKNSSK